jgi:hypothetical protein
LQAKSLSRAPAREVEELHEVPRVDREVGEHSLKVLLLEESLASVVDAGQVHQRHPRKPGRRQPEHALEDRELPSQRGRGHAILFQPFAGVLRDALLRDLLGQQTPERLRQAFHMAAGIGLVPLEPVVLEQDLVHLLERDPRVVRQEPAIPCLVEPPLQVSDRSVTVLCSG